MKLSMFSVISYKLVISDNNRTNTYSVLIFLNVRFESYRLNVSVPLTYYVPIRTCNFCTDFAPMHLFEDIVVNFILLNCRRLLVQKTVLSFLQQKVLLHNSHRFILRRDIKCYNLVIDNAQLSIITAHIAGLCKTKLSLNDLDNSI